MVKISGFFLRLEVALLTVWGGDTIKLWSIKGNTRNKVRTTMFVEQPMASLRSAKYQFRTQNFKMKEFYKFINKISFKTKKLFKLKVYV